MKKLFIIALALVAILTFASCGGKNESETSKTTAATKAQTTTTIQTTETEAAATDRLSFLEKGEVYFDINLASGIFDDLKIKIGDQEVTKSGKANFDGTNKPIVEGTGNGTDIYVVMYSGGLATEVVIATGDLQRTFDIYFKSLAEEKTYVYISDKADGYDTTLDPALTEYLKTKIKE